MTFKEAITVLRAEEECVSCGRKCMCCHPSLFLDKNDVSEAFNIAIKVLEKQDDEMSQKHTGCGDDYCEISFEKPSVEVIHCEESCLKNNTMSYSSDGYCSWAEKDRRS